MATDEFKGILFGLILFTLFSGLIITSAVKMGNNYGRSSDEIGGGALNETVFEESIDTVASKSENYRQRFEGGQVEDVDDPSGLFAVLKDMVSLITTPFQLVSQVMENLLGVPPVVTSVLLGLLALAIILAIWQVLRTGN